MLFASLIIFAMSCLALSLSIIFRSKFRTLNSLPRNLSASVFNKTFVVFNPYPKQRRTIHNYLLISVFIAGFAAGLISLLLFLMIAAGLGLSIFAIITTINLMIVDEAFEVHENAKIFLNAIRNGSELGVGDLNALSHLKILTQKLSYYYFGVAIFLLVLSMLLPYIFYPALLAFCQVIGLMIQVSSIASVASPQFAVFLFSLFFVFFEIFVMKVKGRIFKA